MARTRSASRIGQKIPIPAERAFGTPEEIFNRDHEAVDMPETAFHQIPPADNAGMNLAKADQAATDKSGAMKFSKF